MSNRANLLKDSDSASAFEQSVTEFNKSNVKSVAEDKKKLCRTLLLQSVMVALCIGVFGYAVFAIIDRMIETRRNENQYNTIRAVETEPAVKRSSYLRETPGMYSMMEMLSANGSYTEIEEPQEVTVDIAARRSYCYRSFLNTAEKYSDTYSWIYINCDYVSINYPVMRSPTDNFYYLNHMYNGNESSSGSIYADTAVSPNFDANVNNLIYGHCMRNGMMFRTLKTLMESANRDYVANMMTIELYTEKGLYIYRVFAGYRDSSFFYTKLMFDSEEEYVSFLGDIVAHNQLSFSRDYDAQSRICTLVTCVGASEDSPERYVIHGILTNFIPASSL